MKIHYDNRRLWLSIEDSDRYRRAKQIHEILEVANIGVAIGALFFRSLGFLGVALAIALFFRILRIKHVHLRDQISISDSVSVTTTHNDDFLEILEENNPMSTEAIADELDISEQRADSHLEGMRDQELVEKTEVEGETRWTSVPNGDGEE